MSVSKRVPLVEPQVAELGQRGRKAISPQERPAEDRPLGSGVAPARGLLLGLAIGAFLWICAGVFAWQFFR